ncbi:MAG: hypothetical protein WA667_12200, partial [Candidatus Nitrosopolaris sp.]
MTYEEIKKQRLQFLQKLYEISKGKSGKGFNKDEIGRMLHLDSNSTQTIINYLDREGLVDYRDWMVSRALG